MNDVDPLAWLAQTLERIANRWPISQIVGIDFDTTVEEEAPENLPSGSGVADRLGQF